MLVLLALAVRLVALWAAADARPLLDERLYLQRAEALLDGQGFVGSYQSWVRHPGPRLLVELPQYPGAWQSPLYTLVCAGVLGLTGRSVLVLKLAQAVLGALTVGLVFAIGRTWYGDRHGLLAAAICAVYPNLVAFTHYLWSETLFTFLLALGLWLLTRDGPLPGARAALTAGAVLGFASLTRSVAFALLPLLALWLVWHERTRWRIAAGRAGLLLVAAIAVITPWSVRNTLLHGGFVWLDTGSAFNLWRGNTPSAYRERPAPEAYSYDVPFRSIPLMPVGPQDPRSFVEQVMRELEEPQPTDLQIVRRGRAIAMRDVLADPAGFVRRAWYKVVDLWNPTSFLLRHFRLKAYGPVSPAMEGLISWLAVAAYLGVTSLAVLGWIDLRGDRHANLVLLLAAWTTGLAVVAFGLTRFRLPLVPFLAILAAHAALWVWDRRARVVDAAAEV